VTNPIDGVVSATYSWDGDSMSDVPLDHRRPSLTVEMPSHRKFVTKNLMTRDSTLNCLEEYLGPGSQDLYDVIRADPRCEQFKASDGMGPRTGTLLASFEQDVRGVLDVGLPVSYPEDS
jgi:hypothetical protein